MESIAVKDFDLEKTLGCGQFFRYERKEDGSYLISLRDRLFSVRQEGSKLFFSGVPKEFVIRLFRLDENYQKIIKSISKDEFIRKTIKTNFGMRLMRQDPWECLISYICSANNNIPRIKKNLEMISMKFGKRIAHDAHKGFSFPNPGELSNYDKIRGCGVGFRSRFIHETNQTIEEGRLNSLKDRSYEEAREELIKLKGVGDKIADCVCMFSLEKLEAFPVDVWMRRVMLENYFKGEDPKKISNNRIREFGREYFGRYCGYANQFLFYYRRLQK